MVELCNIEEMCGWADERPRGCISDYDAYIHRALSVGKEA